MCLQQLPDELIDCAEAAATAAIGQALGHRSGHVDTTAVDPINLTRGDTVVPWPQQGFEGIGHAIRHGLAVCSPDLMLICIIFDDKALYENNSHH